MKNYDQYKEKLTEIFREGRQFGVNASTGEPIACDFLPCQNCAFNEIKVGCTECRADWMDSEKLTTVLPSKSVTNYESLMTAINDAADKCRLLEHCDDCPYITAKFPNCRTLYVIDNLLNQGLIDIVKENEEQSTDECIDEHSIVLHTTDGRVEQLTLPCDEDDEHFVE